MVEHAWAVMVQLPAEVILDDQGKPQAFTNPDQVQEAIGLGTTWCPRCGNTLEDAHDLPCVEVEAVI